MRIVPMKEVVFEFPTQYQDTGPEGDKLWNDLMPREFHVLPALPEPCVDSVLQWDLDLYEFPGHGDSTCHKAKPSP
jgi:hypothetical protein